jgi:Cu-processing system permease protein
MSFTRQLARMIALEARRSRLAWLVVIIAAAGLGAAQFLSQIALTEADQVQAALVAAMLRAAGVLLVATFVIASMVREANDKVAELLLSQPIPRWNYLLAKSCAYGLIACLVAAAFALPLAALAFNAGLAFWALSFACELMIVASVALFCVLSLTQVLPAFAATAGFYVLARSVDAMQAIAGGPLGTGPGWIDAAVNGIARAIALIMPGLDRFAQTRWLIDSPPSAADFGLMLGQTAVYLGLIGTASLFDLYRKNY